MTRTTTLAAAAALMLGLSGAAFAQQGTGADTSSTGTSVGPNSAGSKSGVVGRGDSMEGPGSTGTTAVPTTRQAPGTPGTMTNDPAAMPRTGSPATR